VTEKLRIERLTGEAWAIFNGKKCIGAYNMLGHGEVEVMDDVVGWASSPEEVLGRLYRGKITCWRMRTKPGGKPSTSST
jgi:hypothetical protein